MGAERPWEKSYPPGVRWDAAIETATLPALFDAFTAKWAAKPALEYRDRKTSYAELRAGVEAVASGLMDLGRRPGHVGRPLPAEYALPSPLVLRRSQGRRAGRASLPARCRAGACPQARRLGRAHPDHHQHRLHAAAGAEAAARRPRRSSDRGRRHGLRPVGDPDHADRRMGRASCASTSSARREPRSCRGSGRRSTWRMSPSCSTPAAPPASPRAPCSAMPTSAPPARSTRSGAIRSVFRSLARTRSSVCCRCSTFLL